ncbi:MAG: ATPase [Myxococcales bacterium]|nr:ATPase [Myxococcales bacterium]
MRTFANRFASRVLTRLLTNPLHWSPESIVIIGFAAAIGLGGIMLWLPVSHTPGSVSLLNALFTSTSAVCVTGLTVVDTAKDFNHVGQMIIVILIQLGGLGWMVFAALIFGMLGRNLSLKSQVALADSLMQRTAANDIAQIVGRIILITGTIELTGILLLFLFLLPDHPVKQALFSAVFHGISAFCNAGFSIYSENLLSFRANWPVLTIILLLIVLGGLGHTVLIEIWQVFSLRSKRESNSIFRFSLHARTVFWASALLIVGGTLGILLFGMPGEEKSLPEKIGGAIFQSVTARTAGFNSIRIGALPPASLLFVTILMFIGGSPGSCAGGVKTTSMAIWLSRLVARLRGSDEVTLFGKTISHQIVRRTTLLFALAVGWNLFGILLLLSTENLQPGFGLQDVMFEQVSAFATVGLSTGLTPHLSMIGRVWLICSMFMGRVGPLTIAAWIVEKKRVRIQHPEGRIMVG